MQSPQRSAEWFCDIYNPTDTWYERLRADRGGSVLAKSTECVKVTLVLLTKLRSTVDSGVNVMFKIS
jgi:hypothetical protein